MVSLAELKYKVESMFGKIFSETTIKIPAMEFIVEKIGGRFVDPRWIWVGLAVADLLDVLPLAPDTKMFVALKIAEMIEAGEVKVEDLGTALDRVLKELGLE